MSTATDTATGKPRPGRASRPAGRAWPPPPLPPRSASAAPSPPDPRPPLSTPPHPPQTPPAVEPAAARSDIRATAMHSLSVTNPGRPAPAPLQQPITSNYMALGMVRQLKSATEHDMTVGGAGLAGQAIKTGLVDELQLFLVPIVVGGGKRALPSGSAPIWNYWTRSGSQAVLS